jgi:hypothetical protein
VICVFVWFVKCSHDLCDEVSNKSNYQSKPRFCSPYALQNEPLVQYKNRSPLPARQRNAVGLATELFNNTDSITGRLQYLGAPCDIWAWHHECHGPRRAELTRVAREWPY